MNALSKISLAVALALCLLMPSAQSLWMDEAQTWRLAALPTFGTLAADLWKSPASEGMMPLGMLLPWLTVRVLGTGEWALRAVNILWAAATVGAFFVLGRRWRLPWAPLFMAVQPFLWFYANEARPYALQIAAGAWLLVGLVACLEDRRVARSSLLILLVSSGVLIATVLFGILTAGPVCLLIAWLAWRENWPVPQGWRTGVAVALGWWVLLGGYYVHGFLCGATGARLWSVGWQNIAFAFYEFAGFSGLGISRNELRELAQTGGARAIVQAVSAVSLSGLGALGLAYLGAAAALWRCGVREDRRTIGLVGGLAALSGGALMLLALVVHFPFWGRHLAPVFPFFCGVLLLVLRGLRVRRPAMAAVLVPAFFVLLGLSSFALRTAPRHAKDDYRGAVAFARRSVAEGRSVWWCADPETARYYGLPFVDHGEMRGPLVLVSGASGEALASQPPPDLIMVSKPEAFDVTGTVTAYVQEHGYQPAHRLGVFTILAPAR